jgi:hypothetical protein
MDETVKKKPRGLAAMTKEKRRQVQSLGGRSVHKRGTGHDLSFEERGRGGKKAQAQITQDQRKKRHQITASRVRAEIATKALREIERDPEPQP